MVFGNSLRWVAALCLAIGVSGCATNSEQNAALGINDPYEDLNRDIHAFNKGFDRYLLRPVAQGYDAVTPELFQFLIRNAINHLELPRDFANHLLTGEITRAGRTLGRFGVNTIAGAGGLLDLATPFGLEKDDADFGKTLAVAGAGEGIYYENPIFGPSTVRHTVGRIVDLAFAPTSYLGEPFIGAAVTGVEAAETRASNMDTFDSILYDSADSYATTRSVYLQNRRSFVYGRDGTEDPFEASDTSN